MKARLILLTLACLLAAMPATAQVNYGIDGNVAFVASSPNASGNVVIASTYNGYPVTRIGGVAFYNCRSLTGVTIPDSVTNIGGSAFAACTSLANLSVAAANPAYSSVNGGLFDKAQTTLLVCPAGRAGSFVIPDSVTSIGINLNSIAGAFSDCTRLTNVIIGNSVTNIGFAAFFGCTNLTRLTFPASVTGIYAMAFYGCTSLTNFTFLGNPPQLLPDYEAGMAQFQNIGAGAKVYYYCGTTGWGATYGLPTVMLCPPQIAPASAGVKPGGFGFTLTSLTNQTIVVEASTNLVNWQPIWTNPPPGTSTNFVDPEWLNHSNRFYRARAD